MPDLEGNCRYRGGPAADWPSRTGTTTRCTTSTGPGGGSPTPTPATAASSARSGWQTPEQLARYLRRDELHTAFNFTYLLARWDAGALRIAIDDSIDALAAVGAPATWVLRNHDVVRHVTRYGGGDVGVRRARAAALLMLALPGGAYVYQGEELGLPEVARPTRRAAPGPRLRAAPVGRRTGPRRLPRPDPVVGRHATRSGSGPAWQPWLPQPADWAALTVEQQPADPASMLVALPRCPAAAPRAPGAWATARWPGSTPTASVLAFRRDPGFVCVVNVGGEPAPPPDAVRDGALLLSSDPLEPDGRLPGTTSAWYAV